MLRPSPDPAGHVFLVHGDLRRLCCDAWLMPCDGSALPQDMWSAWPPDGSSRRGDDAWPAPPPGWSDGTQRVIRVPDWPAGRPQPYLVDVASTEPGWAIGSAAQFLDVVGEELRGSRSRYGRPLPLVALPIVGTGGGGAASRAGEVVRELLPVLRAGARRHRLDVALVAHDEPAFAAAQAQRHQLGNGWPALDEALLAEADRLAALALRGDLVIFLGAGASAGAGLPLWDGLLRGLAEQAGMRDAEAAALARLDPLDRAQIIEERLGPGRPLRAQIAASLRSHYHSMTHALLAALPVREIVTTNYDTLFELASAATRRQLAVLPHAPAAGAERWILKLHGCIEHPQDIVLTREDYLRYAGRNEALKGIVQAMLITRHMLFVGFSLNDPNFHIIADAVRRAVRTPGAPAEEGARPAFGTALTLLRNPLFQELWRGDLRWAAMAEPPVGGASGEHYADAARRLEIFLDYLLSRSSATASHLLDYRFRGVLAESERLLGAALERFVAELPAAARAAPAWLQIEALLRRLGARPATS